MLIRACKIADKGLLIRACKIADKGMQGCLVATKMVVVYDAHSPGGITNAREPCAKPPTTFVMIPKVFACAKQYER